MKHLLGATALLVPITAQADMISDKDLTNVATAAYVCGLQQMKKLLHKPTTDMTTDGAEFCEIVRTHAKYQTPAWQWLYPKEDPLGGGDPVVR